MELKNKKLNECQINTQNTPSKEYSLYVHSCLLNNGYFVVFNPIESEIYCLFTGKIFILN